MLKLFAKLQDALAPRGSTSKDEAKKRLKLLLIHDQVNLTAAQLESMKAEILTIIKRYCEPGEAEEVELRLQKEGGEVALVSNIPVRRVTGGAAPA